MSLNMSTETEKKLGFFAGTVGTLGLVGYGIYTGAISPHLLLLAGKIFLGVWLVMLALVVVGAALMCGNRISRNHDSRPSRNSV